MLKKMRKRQRRLAAAVAVALALAAPAAPAWADYTHEQVVTTVRAIDDNITITSNESGLHVFGIGAHARMTGLSISVSPPAWNNYIAAWAHTSGQITLTDVTVTTHGPTSSNYGLYAVNSGIITMTGGSITTDGPMGHGAVAGDGFSVGTITLTNTAITTTGANSHGAYARTAGADITLTNTAVTATGAGSYALRADGGGRVTAEVNGQNMSGADGLMAVTGGSTIDLTASGSSRLTGIIGIPVGGGTINLTLNGNAAWTSPSIGSPSLTNLTLNGGSVTLSRPTVSRTLDILGNLGGTGGTFNTWVNIDPLAPQGDIIRISGTASGSHTLAVGNFGGYPTDLRQAIVVVQINNPAGNTATFGGGSDIRPYRYGIAKGSALVGSYNNIAGLDDYYLYNTFTPSTPANAAIATSASASVVWYAEMNEIRKRLGDLRLGAGSGDFWARTYAGRYSVQPGAGQDFDQDMYGLELGKDAAKKYAGGVRHTGWVAGAGRADRSFALGGSGRTDSYYLGGYASWLKSDGSYWDVVAKQNWFRHRFDTPVLGGSPDGAVYSGPGFGLSVEAGKRFERGGGVYVEPYAELAALWTKGRNYTTANGLAVNARAETSLELQAGVAAGRRTALKNGGTRQVYGKVAWIHELAGDNRTTVDGVAFASSLKGGRLVLGAGLVEDTAKRQVYIDVETAWGSKTDKPWGINAGMRWKF